MITQDRKAALLILCIGLICFAGLTLRSPDFLYRSFLLRYGDSATGKITKVRYGNSNIGKGSSEPSYHLFVYFPVNEKEEEQELVVSYKMAESILQSHPSHNGTYNAINTYSLKEFDTPIPVHVYFWKKYPFIFTVYEYYDPRSSAYIILAIALCFIFRGLWILMKSATGEHGSNAS